MTAPKPLARTAGLLYLIVAVGGAFAQVYVRARVIKAGDATATADNIRASAGLFRAGFLTDLMVNVCWLALAMVLYLLFTHVHQLIAAAMVILVTVDVAIQCLNLLNQYTALNIATSQDYTRTFGQAGADALTLLSASMQNNGYLIAQLFFGLWLLPLGWLVIRSGYFPRTLGVLLIVGCFAYLVDLFIAVLAPDLNHRIAPLVIAPAGIAELSFTAWLLVKAAPAAAPDPSGLNAITTVHDP